MKRQKPAGTDTDSPSFAESPSVYRAIFDASRDGIAVIEPTGFYLEQNPTHRTLIGYSDEELRGKTPAIHLGETAFRDIAQRLMETGHFRGEVVSHTKGGPLDIELTAFAIHDDAGKVQAYVGVKRDITALKQAERALRYRLAQMDALFDLKDRVIRAESLDEIYHASLDCLARALKADRSAVLLFDDSGAMRFKAWKGLSERYRRAVEGHSPWPADAAAPQPIAVEDAREEPSLAQYRALFDLEGIRALAFIPLFFGGRLLGKFMVYYNETHCFAPEEIRLAQTVAGTIATAVSRKQAESKLRQQNNLLAAIVDGTTDIVFVKDTRSRYLMVNAAATRVLGMGPGANITGKTDSDLFAPDTARRNRIEDETVMASGEIQIAKEITTAAGRSCSYLVTKAPYYDHDGRIIGVIGVGQDITERRRAEDDRLRAQKLESLGLLAGGIAHDFNNILTAALGNLALARLCEAAKVGEVLDDAERALFRARDLTQQLLTFSQGGAPIRKTASIAELLQETTVFVLRGSQVRCQFSLAEDLWPARIDPGQISQVINNIVINAMQAMPNGGDVCVIAENVEVGRRQRRLPLSAGRYVKIVIADEGKGIPEEHLTKIFDPYFTTKRDGTGLGLATSYSIVKKHEGHIQVESEVGRGTVFTLHLPASDEALRASGASEAGAKRGAGRVLLMDDEEPIRRIGVRLLESLGYEVEAVAHGGEAIECYENARREGRPFDLVILDLTVAGGMGGKECVQRLRALDKDVRAVVSSGYFNDPVMANHRENGFDGVVAKPYQLRELSEELHRILSREERLANTH